MEFKLGHKCYESDVGVGLDVLVRTWSGLRAAPRGESDRRPPGSCTCGHLDRFRDDGLTFTFALNAGAKWHDGADVTAEDVEFSFDSVLNPNLNSQYRSQVREVVASYRVVDADTFEITATDRFVTFLYNAPASVFIIPKHIWESLPVEQWSFDGGSTGEDLSRVVGTGPFLFTDWERVNESPSRRTRITTTLCQTLMSS